MNTPTLHEPKLEAAGAGVELAALLRGAGVARLDEAGWIRVKGEDRIRWLNGMVTNSVQELKPGGPGKGELNYNFFLSAQGRIQGDAYALATESSILLETAGDQVAGLMDLLDRFVIMDDVELADITNERRGFLVAGPKATAALAAVGLSADAIEELKFAEAEWQGRSVLLIHAYSPMVPRYEVWADGDAAEMMAALSAALERSGAGAVSLETAEHLRILEGTPRYGVDLRDKELPQETGQARALHFAKGCYLGQEIVERIRSRGNVHRTFHGFELRGELPVAGAALAVEGKAVGELTSVAAVPLAGGPLQRGLGYIRREVLERPVKITYAGGEALPVVVPYRQSQLAQTS